MNADGRPAPRDAAALAAENARLGSLLEGLADAFCAVDRDWRITDVNRRAAALLALPDGAALPGALLWDALPQLQGGEAEALLRAAQDGGHAASCEFYHAPLDRWFALRGHPAGAAMTCLFEDISARKADAQALRDGSARLHVALAAGRLGDWRWDAGADRFTLGARTAALFELAAETPLAAEQLFARLHPADRAMAHGEFLQALARQQDLNVECRLAPAGPAARWVSLVGRADYADPACRHGMLGMTGVAQDISARKSAEDTLRQSEEVLRALANSIPQLAWMAQADGNIVWYNERWYEYTGTTAEQMAGWGWQSVHDPEVLPLVLQRWNESIRTGNPFDMEFPIRGADGQFRWFL
ncbi:MAG: PAS domain S-box protein, partial [Pseudomonadota bacterium]|nr:PAS domain S-box protein [Pseudomonadota bacterium]